MANELQLGGEIQSFDEEKREIYARVLPWEMDVSTHRGVERFAKGFLEGVDPGRFLLRQRHQDPPTGRGIEIEEKDDALFMRFRVARTPNGDEQLTLAREGIETGVSIGFEDGEVEKTQLASGRLHYYHKRPADNSVLEMSTTYKPAFGQESTVLQVLERTEMAEETQAVPESAPVVSPADGINDKLQEFEGNITRQLEELRDRQTALNVFSGAPKAETHMERIVELQVRELAEVITTDNTGVLPTTISGPMIGRISQGRPFLNSTTQIQPPAAGVTLRMPKITQTPLVAEQVAEKDEVASRKTIISTVDFTMDTYAGAGDLSLQLIRRSSPEFLSLWLELLGDAYALATENAAVDNLLAVVAVVEGGPFDVENPSFGEAYTNSNAALQGLKPNRIWLSTSAIVAMMDARTPSGGGGTPYYPGLTGIGGLIAGGGNELGFSLTPVHVPALDDEAVDIIIGPSSGFAWAEDGTYTLQADVPSKAGRDVGLAGMVWFAPVYPAAFTTFQLAT